jgi:adenine/guanine/hypoxanthine permease
LKFQNLDLLIVEVGLAAAVFSAIGLIHAYQLTPAGVAARFGLLEAPEFAASYLLLALLFLAFAFAPDKRGKNADAGSS